MSLLDKSTDRKINLLVDFRWTHQGRLTVRVTQLGRLSKSSTSTSSGVLAGSRHHS